MARFFIDRPIVAIVIAIVTVIAGLVMLGRLPIAQYPDIVPPIIQVKTTYTGADALAVEEAVATPIEQQINGVQNMIYMKSINGSDGTLTLQVSFDVGTDVNLDQVFTQNRLAQANSQRDKAALEEVRRQITVARMASHDDDIAAAKQSLAAAVARRDAAATRLARRKLAAPAEGTVQQVYYRPGEMVPASRPVVSILPPHNIKLRFFVAQALLPKIAPGDAVTVTCDGCRQGITAKVSFIARQAEFTPPVIYSLEERNKLVFMVEARPDAPDGLRVGQPVQVALGAKVAEAKK